MATMIAYCMSASDLDAFADQKEATVEAFLLSSEISAEGRREVRQWVNGCARCWYQAAFDREELKALIIGRHLGTERMRRLGPELYHGNLVSNRLLKVCPPMHSLRPRL